MKMLTINVSVKGLLILASLFLLRMRLVVAEILGQRYAGLIASRLS